MRKSFIIAQELAPKLKELGTSFYLFRKNSLTMAALIAIGFLLLVAVFAAVLAPYPEDIEKPHPEIALQGPSLQHLCGTDEMGRDIFSRIIYGTRISLQTSFTVVIISFLIGSVLGSFAGYFGGWIDEVIMRITDIFLSFPPLLLAITTTAILGPSLMNAQIAIVIAWWPWYTRLMRSQAISVKEKPYVKAAEAIGTSQLKIIFGHIFPNSISPLIIMASMDVGTIILTVASLSFLGLGAQPPIPEWGLMVSTSRNYFMNAWWYGIFPGIAIFISVLSFNLLGDGFREILDPKTRKN